MTRSLTLLNTAAMTGVRLEVPLRTLLVLEYAVDNDAFLVFSRSTIGRFGSCRFSTRPTKGDTSPLPGIPPELNHNVAESLRSNILIVRADKAAVEGAAGLRPAPLVAKDGVVRGRTPTPSGPGQSPFGWSDELYGISEKGRQVLERSRRALADVRAADARRAEEFVVLKRPGLAGIGAFCKVERRTERRVYVTVIEAGDAAQSTGLIQGIDRPQDAYVHVDDVHAEGMDLDTWERLSRLTREMDAAFRKADEDLRARLAPINRDHALEVTAIRDRFADEFDAVREPTHAPAR